MSDTPGCHGTPPVQELREKLPDVREWLVTKTKPLCQDIGFDYERCAALHNYILKYVELTAALRYESGSRRPHVWYDDVPVSAVNPKIIKFLKTTLHHGQLKFFYGKAGLYTYRDTMESMDHYREGSFTLYCADTAAENFRHHVGKVLYDQNTYKALVIPEHADREYVIQLLSCPPGSRRPMTNQMLNQWTNHSFGGPQVDEAVEAFARLLNQIHSRMTAEAGVDGKFAGSVRPLFDKETLRATKIPRDCFAERFLLKIRTPPKGLLYIAPGVRVPCKEMLSQFEQFILSPRLSRDAKSTSCQVGPQPRE
ncbi:hypothetical protein BKA64DRAFT_754397 [Cadophora sp. MPI-SDFR-AT-0126]|nr:hypothetical protein BKA64DRAFT_754397 [Leotiomycetes sp. MPI-SDFR-AT-0126]